MIKDIPYKLRKLFIFQVIILFLGGLLLAAITKNVHIVLSFVLGVGIVILLHYIYVKIAFLYGLVVIPTTAFSLHKKAMLVKFITNIMIFILIFALYKNCNYFILFIGYILAQFMSWFILLKI